MGDILVVLLGPGFGCDRQRQREVQDVKEKKENGCQVVQKKWKTKDQNHKRRV